MQANVVTSVTTRGRAHTEELGVKKRKLDSKKVRLATETKIYTFYIFRPNTLLDFSDCSTGQPVELRLRQRDQMRCKQKCGPSIIQPIAPLLLQVQSRRSKQGHQENEVPVSNHENPLLISLHFNVVSFLISF